MSDRDKAIHEFIHAMSAHEHGYYVKHQHASPAKYGHRHMMLYRLLRNMKELDKHQLKHFKATEMGGSTYARVRHYLYHSLMQCLCYYHRNAEGRPRVEQLLRQAHLFFDHYLPHHGLEELRSALQLVVHTADYGLCIQTALECGMRMTELGASADGNAIISMLTPADHALYCATKMRIIVQSNAQLLLLRKEMGVARAAFEQASVERIGANLREVQLDRFSDPRAPYLYHRAWHLYHLLLDDALQALHHIEAAEVALRPLSTERDHVGQHIQCRCDVVQQLICNGLADEAHTVLHDLRTAIDTTHLLPDGPLVQLAIQQTDLLALTLAVCTPDGYVHPKARRHINVLHHLLQLPPHQRGQLLLHSACLHMRHGRQMRAFHLLTRLFSGPYLNHSTPQLRMEAEALGLINLCLLGYEQQAESQELRLRRKMTHLPAHQAAWVRTITTACRSFPFNRSAELPQWVDTLVQRLDPKVSLICFAAVMKGERVVVGK